MNSGFPTVRGGEPESGGNRRRQARGQSHRYQPVDVSGDGACLPRGTHSALPQYGLAEGEFWQHLVASSLAAEGVQRRSTRSLPLEASTAALLHDIGKLMIGRLVDRESLEYLECARELGEGIEVEMAILDTHHAEVGGLVRQHWHLPLRVVSGSTHHHTPNQGDDLVCDVVHVANEIANG